MPEDVHAHKGGEEEEHNGDKEEDAGVCAVCEKEEEEHLMTVCDTCQLHYHIHCLDPPLSKVPKKTAKWGWQCHQCSHQSGDELTPLIPNFDEPSSRSGRRIKVPQALSYDNQVSYSSGMQGNKLLKINNWYIFCNCIISIGWPICVSINLKIILLCILLRHLLVLLC